jgi:hypothetical protein
MTHHGPDPWRYVHVVTEPSSRPPVGRNEVRRALRAGRDAGLGYGFAFGRAGLRAAIGLGRAGTDVAIKVLDQSPVGDAAASVADRLEPAAERARRQRAATAEEVEVVVGTVVNEVVRLLNVDGIVRQVDVDALVQRVDVDNIVSRLDIEDIISRVDVDGIVRRTEVGTLIVQSTGGLLTQLLDFVRSLGVSLDAVATKATDRVLHGGRPRPVAPVLLARPADGVTDLPATPVVSVVAVPPTELGA